MKIESYTFIETRRTIILHLKFLHMKKTHKKSKLIVRQFVNRRKKNSNDEELDL